MGEEAVMISEESVEMVLDEEEVDQHKSFNKLESLLFLRVLLVEADDSSRIIISALLRKCGYKVAAVADGLKAWEILRGRPSDIDLVLTEVELPSIAGFSLLAMIMDDDICRQIPVIMMSSQDSVNVVFNCMLKGAADFLVKPVRKNELRNLWQHVWRRNSLSNGEQNVHRNQQKDEAIDENCSAKCSSDCMALPKKHKDCSEKGSDAQSSCAKPAIGAMSANVQNFWHPECKTTSLTDGLRASKYGEFVEVDNILVVHEDETKDKSIILVHEVLSCDEGYNSVGLNPGELSGERVVTCLESKNHLEDTFNHVETSGNNNELQPSREAMDLIGVFDNRLHMYNHHFQVPPTERQVHWYPNGGIDKFSSTSLLELSLRRPHSDHDIPQISEKKTLNHSNVSAFSRYANRTIQAPLVASIDFCGGITAEVPPQSDIKLSNFPETMASFGDQSGEAKTAFESTQPGVISVPIPVRGTRANSLCPGYGAIFPTLLYTQPDLHSATSVGQQISCLQDQSTTNAPHQTIHGLETTLKLSEDPRHVFPATAQSATGSLCNSAVSHLNSNECRSECNVTTLGAGAGTMKDNGILFQEGTKEIDSHCLNQREVALNKFRLKRKDRCFEKKVRYQSRKRLAEQRPRVKGQFVRQMPS